MPETVDDIMARCPLKHDIRVSLWVPFARKVAGSSALGKYLTLYSPPMMDIKHFHHNHLLDYDGETYRGVVAVTYIERHFAEAMKKSAGRPALLLHGDIDQLLTAEDTPDAKRLRSEFPFQVINLDYTNWLFGQANPRPISEHLQAIEEIIRLQHRTHSDEFVLFVTTRAERGGTPTRNRFTGAFLRELSDRIDENLGGNPEFSQSFRRCFGDFAGKDLLARNYKSFVPLGISKLVAGILARHSYEIESADGRVLVRDQRGPVRWLLHLAFHIRSSILPRASRLRELGRPKDFYFERTLAGFVDLVGNGNLLWLSETADGRRLDAKHGAYVRELFAQTLDLGIPEPR